MFVEAVLSDFAGVPGAISRRSGDWKIVYRASTDGPRAAFSSGFSARGTIRNESMMIDATCARFSWRGVQKITARKPSADPAAD